MEKQPEKNTIIDFLNTQLVASSQDISKSKCNHNIIGRNRINKDKIMTPYMKKKALKIFMLNNINSRGLSKSKEVDVLNFPGASSSDILTKIDHVGTNDLTSDMNLLSNIKKIVNKSNNTSPNTVLTFSNTIFRKDKTNLEKSRADTNSRLKNSCWQKKINFISNDDIKEEHLGIKKLHLNRTGTGIFAKNLNFIEGN